jgi:hypothetical protein
MEGTGRHAPNLDISHEGHRVGGPVPVLEHELRLAVLNQQAFDAALAIHEHDHDIAVLWGKAAVYDEEIAIEDARVSHAVACDPEQEGGGAVSDEVAVQIDLALKVVVCRAWEACAQGMQDERDVDLIAVDDPKCLHPVPLCSDENRTRT